MKRWIRPSLSNIWCWTNPSRSTNSILVKSYASKPTTEIDYASLPQGYIGPPPLAPFNHPIRRKRLSETSTTTEVNEKYDLYPKGQLSSNVLRVHRENMDMYPDCIVLTKVGGFYELYFEQAVEYAPILNLRLAKKRAGIYKGDGTKSTDASFVPMAGFPANSLERYLKTLVVDIGRYVAISEEIPKDNNKVATTSGLVLPSSGAQFDRIVTRIVTPGTLIDEKFMDPYRHNYLVSIYIDTKEKDNYYSTSSSRAYEMPIGLAWVDLSTGDFITQNSCVGSLTSHLVSIGPSEVVIDSSLTNKNSPHLWIYQLIKDSLRVMVSPRQSNTTKKIDWPTFSNNWQHVFEASSDEEVKQGNDIFSRHELSAAESLLEYLKERLPHLNMKLQYPQQRKINDRMMIDSATLQSLEIYKTMRDQTTKGSFISIIQRTTTQSGARLLADRITSPSMSISEINRRLDLVEIFYLHPKLKSKIIDLLKQTHDSLRILQKFTIGRGDEIDMLSLAYTFKKIDEIVKKLVKFAVSQSSKKTATPQLLSSLCQLIDKVKVPRNLADKILDCIDERVLLEQQQQQQQQEDSADESDSTSKRRFSISPQTRLKSVQDSRYEESFIIKPNASKELALLHKQLDEKIDGAIELEKELQLKYGANEEEQSARLELKYMPGMGYVVYITNNPSEMDKIYKDMHLLKSGSKTKIFLYPKWNELGQEKNKIVDEIKQQEMKIFGELKREILSNIVSIRQTGQIMDEIDISCGFAQLAIENNFVRPKIDNSSSNEIIGGRHPTVEASIAKRGSLNFIENDCILNQANEMIWVITGPNMAGKSTFLRQNALIIILAQTGSFVPCKMAKIGIVDKLFSRVGSADNLYMDQSTFMVEMLEVSNILTMATNKSFIIMDEVGRGTTSDDGLAIAYASLEYISSINKSRGLFATHYHQVADFGIDDNLNNIGHYCTDVITTYSGGFYYEHKLKRGINRQSHALKVAHLAGMPSRAIEIAKSTAQRIKAAK